MEEKRKSFCDKYGEVTTQHYMINAMGSGEWICCCCESQKKRSTEKVKQIKKTRKGWTKQYYK